MQGHIHKRTHTCKDGRKSVLWYVVVDLPRGDDSKRRQKWHGGFRTRKAAEAVRARLVHELTTGFYVEPSTMRLDEWLLDHWLPVVDTRVKPTTHNAYRSAIRHHIAPIGVVSERLGHASPEFTLHRYAHVMPGMQREAADRIARAVHHDDLTAA